MYLEYIARDYSFILTPDWISMVGLVALIAIAAIIIFDLGKKLKPPGQRDKSLTKAPGCTKRVRIHDRAECV